MGIALLVTRFYHFRGTKCTFRIRGEGVAEGTGERPRPPAADDTYSRNFCIRLFFFPAPTPSLHYTGE